ncbi:MAG: VanZ family protein [Armatimonadetes bacterium]|nr:VanZ family protein [Armatimonadota bacterium]
MTVAQAVPLTALILSPLVAWTFPGLRRVKVMAVAVAGYLAAYAAAAYAASAMPGQESGPPPEILLAIGGLATAAVVATLVGLSPHPVVFSRWAAPTAMVGVGVLTAFLSGPQGGPGRLMHFLLDVLHLSPEAAQTVNFLVRKGTHLTVYGLLGWSAGTVAVRQGADRRWTWAAGLAWVVVHASLDEAHQSTTSVRTGAFSDVLLDTSGAAVALMILDAVRNNASRAGKG